MAWWIKVAGTGDAAYTQERWDERRAELRANGSGRSLFPRRPRVGRGDRFVVYASGSAALYGEARFIAVEEVLSEEPEPSGNERWRALSATEPGYAPPVIYTVGGTRQLIIWHPEAINSLDPETGKVYWTQHYGNTPYIKAGLNDVAKQWDAITKRLGADRIKASYAQFLKLPGATSKNTIAALGQAVHIT